MAKGFDYAWGRPNLQALKDAGGSFVIRYHSHDDTGKNLTAGEAAAIRASGLDLVSNWEFAPDGALNGRAQGVSDAANGINQLVACGGPGTAAIYFSVDFDAQSTDMHAIAAYFDGAVATIGYDRVGVYGGYYTVASMAARNTCRYYWQTSAWSGGQWHPQAVIHQVGYEVMIGGAAVDIDLTTAANIGSWGGTQSPPPPAGGGDQGWDLTAPLQLAADWFNQMTGRLQDATKVMDSFNNG